MNCLSCAIKTKIAEKKVKRPHKCADCLNGVKPIKCDNCDETLVYCNITKYYHDGNTPNNCMWFKPKK